MNMELYLDTADIGGIMSEVAAYGTAVTIKPRA